MSSNGQLRAGLCGMQGWRPEMEDEHIAQDMPTRRDHIFLCVFDGYIFRCLSIKLLIYKGHN